MPGIFVHRALRTALRLSLAALVALAAPGEAVADGWSLRLEPGYSASRSTTSAEGVTSELESTAILQNYSLGLEKTLFPLVRLGAGGTLDWTQGTTTSGTGSADNDAKRWMGYGRLDVGAPNAGGGAGYERREQSNRFEPRDSVSAATSTRLVNDTYSGYAVLKPEGLPEASLRLSRTDTYDAARTEKDQQADQVSLDLRYAPTRQTDLRYSLRAGDSNDRISGVESRQLNNFVRASYQDLLLDRRLNLYASYDVNRGDSRTTVSGVGGIITEQQFPIRGLSALEIFPALPEHIALDQNPALVDANLIASAGIDIGWSHAAPNDDRPRHMGVQFADAVTPVGLLYVWIDRSLPPDVASAYTRQPWSVYQSDDNLAWTRVDPASVVFGALQNRFEITIPETRARYLKVVTTRLPVGVTFDPQFANVFITELQTYRVQQAAAVRGRRSSTQGSFNGALRYDFASVKGASYDVATSLRHGGQFERPAWSVTNGLGYLRQVRQTLLMSGRLERSDSDDGRGHESGTRYMLTLGASPLPTLFATATLTGGYTQSVGGSELRNGFIGSVGADLYRGVAVNGTGSVTYSTNNTGRNTLGFEGSTTASLVPHRTLSMSATFAATDSRAEGGGLPSHEESQGRVEATASFTPYRVLYVSGSLSRFIWGPLAPNTLANFSVGLSLLPDSPLLLRFLYQESFDSAQELKTRVAGPALRWTIRPRWFLESSYSYFESTSPTLEARSRVFFAHLLGVIGG